MTDDDPARPNHTKYVPRINPAHLNLRIVRVDTPKYQPVTQLSQHLTHAITEETAPRSKIVRPIPIHSSSRICLGNTSFHRSDLVGQLRVTKRPTRLIVHCVIPQLIAIAHEILEDALSARGLCANYEERSSGVVGDEQIEDLGSVL